jgi:hypothetical protein
VREVVKIVFNDELAGDILNFNTHVFWAVKWGAEVEVFKSKLANFADGRERTLLMRILTSSNEPVLVPQSPG